MEVERVMNLGCCTEEEAKAALLKTNGDVVEAIALVMNIPESKWAPKKRELDETQKHFSNLRKIDSDINASIEAGFKKSGQPGASRPAETSIQMSPGLRYLDYDCTQSSHLALLEEEGQTQGTACQ